MKLALYFFSLAGEGGGAERSIVRLADEMTTRGHQVHLVSWDTADARAFYPLPPAVRWHRLGTGGAWAKVRRTVRLVGVLRRERPDLFVGFVMGADRSIYTVNRLLRIPIVAAERNAPDMYRMRLPAPAADAYLHLFALCRGIAVQFESYRAGYPVPVRNRIAVIPNVVDPAPAIADPGRESGRRTLLSVGRLSAQKGFDVLIDAFAALAARFPQWDLRIVGEGEQRAPLEERIRRHGLGERVRLPGSARDVHAEYLGAHLFVLPSRWEGFPNALAEAMAHGLPAVGFAGAPGVNELIANGETGVLAAGTADAKSLADALATLMEDTDSRRRMGANAAAAMRHYAADVVFERWALFLERCASGPAPDFGDLT